MVRRTRAPGAFEEALTRRVGALRALLLAGALAAVIVLAALAAAIVWRQYEVGKREAVSELRARAVLAATVFDTYFAGQLEALSAIAASPSVRAGDTEAMRRYFAAFRPRSGRAFTAGVGWIDLGGRQRATSDPRGPIRPSLADRSYFERVVETKAPFVSEAIVARQTRRRILVMAVPTRDAGGRFSGVLAGGLVLQTSTDDARATDLGFAGLRVIDRTGQQVTLRNLARPVNTELVAELRRRKEGFVVGTRGLDGSTDRVIAFASATIPGWTAVLDQPTGVVFAGPRRGLLLEAALIGIASVFLLLLIGWAWRRARAEERAGRAQVRRWAQLTHDLNQAESGSQVRDIVSTALASEFPEATVLVSLERGDRSELQPAAVVHGRRSALGRLDEGVSRGIADELVATTSPLNLETSAELDALPGIAAIGRVRSLYAIPLSDTEDAEQGAAALLFASERGLPGYRHPLLQAHVDQAAQALGRVRRHEHEHNLAVLLQESLLPKTLPETEGLSLGAYYRAGAVNTEVGGDWYDVVRRADGILQLTVGDVAGRGIEAAIAMSQLRSAFRAYALDHASPGAIVERLGRHVESDGMATVVCVAYDPFTRELTYAVAGHLPPLLRDAGALEVSRLDTTATGPLGWTASPSAADTRLTVPDGTLALYTDGLVEKRGRSIDEGIDRLARALEESPTASAAALVDTIVERGEAANDDIALLLLQIDGVPSRFQVELAAETQMLRELRRRVRLWLANRGVGEDAVTDAVLALNEACANAIEHAYRDGPGTIDLDLEHADDRLVMVVEDHGSWRKPTADPTRGRGLVLMQGLMHRTDVSQSQTGTRVLLQQNL